MRIFLSALLFIFVFAFNTNAQTEIARRAFVDGVNAARAGEYEKALKDFQNALEKQRFSNDSSNAFAAKINYNIGVCYYHLNLSNEAVFYLTKAVELGENKNRNAFYALAMAHVELEDWVAAKTAFRAAIDLQRGRDGESWFDLGTVYLREKDFKNAAAAFHNAIRYQSADAATAHNNRGVIFAFGGDWKSAKSEFETALDLSGGTLREAKQNLEISRRQNANQNLTAKLEFSRKSK